MSQVRTASRVEARLEPYEWLWAQASQDLVAAHWADRKAARPALFNGRVLMVASLRQAGDVVSASFFATDYANLIAWIESGFPGEPVWNGFAMGALAGSDGGYLLGRMGAHTANAGRLYFPCGTPDLSDVTSAGEVDLAASLVREIVEETGIPTQELAVDPGWTIVEDGGLLAFIRPVRLSLEAEAATRRIRAHIASEVAPELADVEIIRGPADLADPAMPGVVRLFLEAAFAASDPRPGHSG